MKCRQVLLLAADGRVCQLQRGHAGAHVEADASWTDDDMKAAARRVVEMPHVEAVDPWVARAFGVDPENPHRPARSR